MAHLAVFAESFGEVFGCVAFFVHVGSLSGPVLDQWRVCIVQGCPGWRVGAKLLCCRRPLGIRGMTHPISLDVNGMSYSLDVGPGEPMVLVLRNRLGRMDVKVGSGFEQCDACAALVNGESTLSCARPAAGFAGKEIERWRGCGALSVPIRCSRRSSTPARRSADTDKRLFRVNVMYSCDEGV